MERVVGILKGEQVASCDEFGRYSRLQCNGESLPSCWCVDESTGEEIENTKSYSTTLSHCEF